MAIISINQPETVSMARQPIHLGLTSNLPVEEHTINRLRWNVSGDPTVGETITLTYGDVSETLEVLAVADDSGTTIGQQGASSLATYANRLVEELQQNYALFLAFNIYYENQGSNHYIQFAPREDRTLDWSFTGSLSNITVDIVTSSNAAYQPNPGLVVVVEVYDPYTDDYGTPIQHDLPLLATGEEVLFDLHKDFNMRHHLPPVNTIGAAGTYFTICTDNIRRYRFRYAEKSGRPARVKVLKDIKADFYALHGVNSFASQYASFWTFWESNGRFLSNQSSSKTISIDQPEWLYWMGRAFGKLDIFVTATHRSGVITTYERPGLTAQLGQVYAIKAGFQQLNLPIVEDDPIINYRVELINNVSSSVSESVLYTITGVCGEYERFFLFGNSLGGCDTVRATGKFIAHLDTVGQDAQRIVTEDTINEGRGADFQYNVRGRNAFEGSVGYRSASYIAYLQELLLSPEAWIIDVQNLRFNPILIDRGTIEVIKDSEDLFTLRFRYRHAWEEKGLGVSEDGQRIQLPPSFQLD